MKNKRIILISLIFNIVLLASLIFLVFRTGVLSENSNEQPFSNPQYAQRLTLFEKVETKETDVVFLGDSITERGLWDELFPDVKSVNRGIGSDTSQGVLERIDNVIKLNPQKIFLSIGINDLSLNVNQENTISNFQSIINEIKSRLPESDLYIQSVLPVRNDYSLVNNNQIDELNSSIEKLAKDNGVFYLDVATRLKDEKGGLADNYTVDGIHLTGPAYIIWSEMLSEYIN